MHEAALRHRIYFFSLKQRWIRFICDALMSYNVGNIIAGGMLGPKVIKGVLLDPGEGTHLFFQVGVCGLDFQSVGLAN